MYKGKKKPAKGKGKPHQNPIAKYLGADPVFQQGINELIRTGDQYAIGNNAAVGDVKQTFNTTLGRMRQDKTKSTRNITDDYGARGLVNSGLYVGAVNDYNNAYQDRVEDITTDRSKQLRNLQQERRNFYDLNRSKKQELRLDAIRRRAEKLGIR